MGIFRVVARVKTETNEGTKYRVKLKASAGHTLTLVDNSSEIFKGFPMGHRVDVEIKNQQSTLEAAE